MNRRLYLIGLAIIAYCAERGWPLRIRTELVGAGQVAVVFEAWLPEEEPK